MYQPRLLGVLNLSVDSSTQVSIAAGRDEALRRGAELAAAGADYIDIGARSTGEFARILDQQQELERLAPCLEWLRREGHRVSVDTWGTDTAVEVLRQGVDMLNFTGQHLATPMLRAAAEAGAELVLTYMPQGDPYQMRQAEVHRPTPEAIRGYFQAALARTAEHDLAEVVLDPNVGILHNGLRDPERLVVQAEIVAHCRSYRELGRPLLLHSSRQQDANSRAVVAASIISQRPEYIRTHYPDLIRQLVGFVNQGSGHDV